jgi:hypothetical protein
MAAAIEPFSDEPMGGGSGGAGVIAETQTDKVRRPFLSLCPVCLSLLLLDLFC